MVRRDPALKPKVALLLGWLVAVLLTTSVSQGVEVLVTGGAQLDVSGTRQGDALLIRGELRDDAGASLGDRDLIIELLDARGDRVGLPAMRDCLPDGGGEVVRRTTPFRIVAKTDARGSFCLRGEDVREAKTTRVKFEGSDLYEPVEKTSAVELEVARLTRTLLQFESPPQRIDLDRDEVSLTGALRIDRRDSQRFGGLSGASRSGLTVVLLDERNEKLATGLTSGDGRVRMTVPTDVFDGPGPGRLRLRFGGSKALAPSEADHPVVRIATATLSLASEVDAADPEEGFEIEVSVGSRRGPVESGVVEAVLAGKPVGAAEVRNGSALVLARFPRTKNETESLQLRFVSAAPWWRPGPSIDVEATLAKPSRWRQIVLALLVAVMAGWILAQWRRAPKPAKKSGETEQPPPSGRPGVEVVATRPGATGWRGHVIDAHDGHPIAAARVCIQAPSFEGTGEIIHAQTDEQGRFELDTDAPAGAQLRVVAALHAAHEQPLPPPSTLRVALVTRRRALINRLVKWARAKGAPFDRPPEPTPGHVRRAAARRDDRSIEAWAQKVENAVFGAAPVDEQAEEAVVAAEPDRSPAGYAASPKPP